MNSANRQKLLQEYADQNRRPLQMKINNEAVIIQSAGQGRAVQSGRNAGVRFSVAVTKCPASV